MTKKELKRRVKGLSLYGKYLQSKLEGLQADAVDTGACQTLLARIDGMRRDKDPSLYAMGWNDAVGHIKAVVEETLMNGEESE